MAPPFLLFAVPACEHSATAARLVAAGDIRAVEFSMDHLAERYVDLYRQAIASHVD